MSLEPAHHQSGVAGPGSAQATSFWKSKAALVAGGFLLVGLFFLLTEHWAHVLGVLPYLLILACPLMHLFMHRGHSGHGSRHGQPQPKNNAESGADS